MGRGRPSMQQLIRWRLELWRTVVVGDGLRVPAGDAQDVTALAGPQVFSGAHEEAYADADRAVRLRPGADWTVEARAEALRALGRPDELPAWAFLRRPPPPYGPARHPSVSALHPFGPLWATSSADRLRDPHSRDRFMP